MPWESSEGAFVHRVAKAYDGEIIFHDLAALLGVGGVVDLLDAEHDILERGEPREQAGRLKHDAAIGAGVGDFLTREHDAALE